MSRLAVREYDCRTSQNVAKVNVPVHNTVFLVQMRKNFEYVVHYCEEVDHRPAKEQITVNAVENLPELPIDTADPGTEPL